MNNSNIDFISEYISPGTSHLVLFYTGILFSFITFNLISNTIKNLINDNIFVQHCIGFIALFTSVSLSFDSSNRYNPLYLLLYSIPLYILYLISIKIHKSMFICMVILLFVLYILSLYKQYIYNKKDITDDDKTILIQKINNIQKIMHIIIITLILSSFCIKLYMKTKKYKNYDIYKHIFSNVLFHKD